MINKIDNIDFADSFIPPLLSGDYNVAATQESTQLGSSSADYTFRVEGPRFQLEQETINCLYPPAGMRGSFGVSLPHIAFNRKTMPWERTTDHEEFLDNALNGDAPQPSGAIPWLCLLLLCGEEIVDIQSGTVKDLLTLPTDVYFPNLWIKTEEYDESVQYVDIDRELFLNIAPTPDELKLLSHARKLDMSQKHDNFMSGESDDWVSVLVSNRLPESSPQGVLNRVYAISLEGFDHYDTDPELRKKDKVRFIILYSWDFYSVTQQLHFKEMLSRLNVGGLALPQNANAESEVYQAVKNGYIPVRHTLRNGDTTVSFYRGPLTPIKRNKINYTADSADALYKYDPAKGMFDISYAAAWQRGRVQTLADRSIAVKIMKMRINNRKRKHANDLNRALQNRLGYKNGTGGLEEKVFDIIEQLPSNES